MAHRLAAVAARPPQPHPEPGGYPGRGPLIGPLLGPLCYPLFVERLEVTLSYQNLLMAVAAVALRPTVQQEDVRPAHARCDIR